MTETTPTTLHALFDRNPPESACIIPPSTGPISYGDMAALADRFGTSLIQAGLEPGHPILVWLPNVAEWVAALIACARFGSPLVAVNTRFRVHELEMLLIVTKARVLVTSARLGKVITAEVLASVRPDLLHQLDCIVVVDDEPHSWPVPIMPLASSAPPMRCVPQGGPDSPIIVFTTSGTTSAPKLVIHRQVGVTAHALAVAGGTGLDRPGTKLLQLAPFCGAFGFSQIVSAIAAGAPSVVAPTFDGREAAALAKAHGVTNAFGTDDMLVRMLDACAERVPFPSLRFFGHANFNPELRNLGERAADREVYLRGLFGMSESLALFAIQPELASLARRQAPGGLPLAGTARVRDLETGDLLPAGVPGELELSGPGIMSGYLYNDVATAAALQPDGFLRTGDLATLTEDGGFLHLGRMGDAMRLGGFLVDPAEIEQTLLEGSPFRAAQVVDIVTPAGRRPVAFVLAGDSPQDEQPLIEHCRKVLAPFKVPIRVFFLDEFPVATSANGAKVQRSVLRARAQAWLDGDQL